MWVNAGSGGGPRGTPRREHELVNSAIDRCSEECLACQQTLATRPSQKQVGRVSKNVRKEASERVRLTKLRQLTHTDRGGTVCVVDEGLSRAHHPTDGGPPQRRAQNPLSENEADVDTMEDCRVRVRLVGKQSQQDQLSEAAYDVDAPTLHSHCESIVMQGKAVPLRQGEQTRAEGGSTRSTPRAEVMHKLVQAHTRAMLLTAGTASKPVAAGDGSRRDCDIDSCLFYIFKPYMLIVLLYVRAGDHFCFTPDIEWKTNFFRDFGRSGTAFRRTFADGSGHLSRALRRRGVLGMDFLPARTCGTNARDVLNGQLSQLADTDGVQAVSGAQPRLHGRLLMDLVWGSRCSRPAWVTSCSYLARFSHSREGTRCKAPQRLLQHLKGAAQLRRGLERAEPASHTASLVIASYTDADHANNKKTVGLSSTGAEQVALPETARDMECTHIRISEFAVMQTPMTAHGDNHASFHQAENARNDQAARHVAVRYRYASFLVEHSRIAIAEVASLQNKGRRFHQVPLNVDWFRTSARVIERCFSANVEEFRT
ncbi:hypothetical protein CYMTET_19255 [Cymbomonas tetramitiformis]|uniref:Uncharacterized protein n=1 Tax=Cymbomonas tetramitiformis TaxID=36881 RepID=A0AAE0G6G6_9CHLO|nr:hypothetical protein CYMTET_19255 [Cymbomonas tetramitiformis]